MIEYRNFCNSDPPRLLTLWNESGLGRGAATGVSLDLLDRLLFSQPYFDRRGLFVACDGQRLVGMAHAGFGCDHSQSELSHDEGVICQLVVHPDVRRQGVGRELIIRSQQYLADAGATSIHAGPGPGRDPFYCGLYGGSESAGFLATDDTADRFLAACGFEPTQHFVVYQRPLMTETAEVVDYKSMKWKRRSKLEITAQHDGGSWWWNTRIGRLDYVRFRLVSMDDDDPLASLTLVGLDQPLPKWTTRSLGLIDIHVFKRHRRQGLGRFLLTETLRRLKQESISLVETHAVEGDVALSGLLTACSFQRIDAGTQYQAANFPAR